MADITLTIALFAYLGVAFVFLLTIIIVVTLVVHTRDVIQRRLIRRRDHLEYQAERCVGSTMSSSAYWIGEDRSAYHALQAYGDALYKDGDNVDMNAFRNEWRKRCESEKKFVSVDGSGWKRPGE